MNGANAQVSSVAVNDANSLEYSFLQYKVSDSSICTCNEKLILCSPVVQMKKGSKLNMSCKEYLKILREELKRAALHKSGVSEIESWEAYIDNLANGCLNFQLMAVNHFSAIKIDLENYSQNSKEAAFILYNHARLCTLFNNFECLIKEEAIPSLPSISTVDFTLLKHNEEWELFWLFIHKYPELLQEITKDIIGQTENKNSKTSSCFPTHTVAKFLHRLSHCLSVYYNRIHILPSHYDSSGKVSSHLLPVLWARIYLLKGLHLVMKSCLESLLIVPPSTM